MALQSAEDQFREDMVKRARRRDNQIQMAAINVIGAVETFKSSKVVPWRDVLGGRYGAEVDDEQELSGTFGAGWGKTSDKGKGSDKSKASDKLKGSDTGKASDMGKGSDKEGK